VSGQIQVRTATRLRLVLFEIVSAARCPRWVHYAGAVCTKFLCCARVCVDLLFIETLNVCVCVCVCVCDQGEGTYAWPNGDYYEGQWHDGQRSGKGKMVFKSGPCLGGRSCGAVERRTVTT